MSSAVTSEEHFHCSICLEVFSEPVSTPCGHNFCKRCISQHWDSAVCCKCPLCNEVFTIRPQLKKNTLISEMLSQFKQETQHLSKKVSKSVSSVSKSADVQCDVCSEPKLKALKSCLVCLSSFCEIHLQPHLTVSGLKRHQLMEPVDNLEERVCPKHQRPLELFCHIDQSCICSMCVLLEHKNHEYVSVEEACEHRRISLLQVHTQTQLMVEQRRLKVQEIQRRLDLSETEKDREAAAGLQAFTVLMQSVQRSLDHFLEQLQEKHRNNQRQAQELLQQLQQEICELEKSSTEAQQLSLSTDALHFLQHCPALPPAALKDWSSVSFEPQTCEGSAARALSDLQNSFSEELNKVMMKAELKRVQQFAVDVSLDPDTAHPNLVLSEDLKQVCCSDVKKELPDSPLSFDSAVNVLGKQSFSSGKFYFEVQVKDKTKWDLGVAKESIKRKGTVIVSPKYGQWSIRLRNKNKYSARSVPPVSLSLQSPPQKVGVFVDYGAGLVSFYDVDSADLIYSFTNCRFKEKLLPLFSPYLNEGGANSAPLIISAVEPDFDRTTPYRR